MKNKLQKHRESFKAINAALVDSYSFRKNENNYETFLNKARKVLESINDDYFEYAFETLPDLKYDRSNKRNSLEGDIAFLNKHNLIPVEINSYMHIVRQAGNVGSHKNQKPKEGFVDICDKALRGIVSWYVCEYLELDYDVDEEVKKARSIIIPHKPDKEAGNKKPRQKNVKLILLSIFDVVKQFLIIIVGTIILYFILNKFDIW